MIYISEISDKAPDDKRCPLETEVYAILNKLKIPFQRVDNASVSSMEECVEINEALGVEIRKTIFLSNKKKTSFYLLVMPAEKPFDTSVFAEKVGCGRVSFAAPEHLLEHLGVLPGSVTIMGLINDKEDYVQLMIDKEVAESEWFGCNPGVNTSHLKIKTERLINSFLPHIRHNAIIVEL